jgi:hypothetical protein
MAHSGVVNRSVDVFVVDSPRAATAALQAQRPGAESTHLLCRHATETSQDFTARVLRRMARICKSSSIGALWYVVGPETLESRGSILLVNRLLAMLGADSNLHLVSPESREGAGFEWLSTLTTPQQLNQPSLPAHGAGPALALARRSERELASPARSSQRATSSHALPPPHESNLPLADLSFSHAFAI